MTDITPQDILDDAKLAGFEFRRGVCCTIHSNGSWVEIENKLTKFAELRDARLNTKLDEVRAKELEECAELLDAINTKRTPIVSAALATAAHAIRNKGKLL